MNPLVICIGIVILLIIVIAVILGLFENSNDLDSGCGCIVVIIIGIIALVIGINALNSVMPSVQNTFQNTMSDLSTDIQETVVSPVETFFDHLIHNVLPALCILGMVIFAICFFGYALFDYLRSKNQSADTTVMTVNSISLEAKKTNSKKKNDAVILGDDGELVAPNLNETALQKESLTISFAGKNTVKSVTQEFDLEKGMYRVDFKVPIENELSVEIVDLSIGSSDNLLNDEEQSGSTLYNNKKTGRFVLKIKLDTKPRDSWSVSLTPLK